jgi:hypothetical protein
MSLPELIRNQNKILTSRMEAVAYISKERVMLLTGDKQEI